MLEYSLIKQHRPRFNVRLRDDKSYPFLAVTLDDEWPRAMVDAGRASARASATSGPTATPTPSARRSTCCCARSRSAPARDNKFDQPPAAGPALPAVPHREVLRARASARSTTTDYDELVAGADRLPRRRHRRRSSSGSSAEMRDGRRRARVRAGGPAARPARRGAQGHREAADGGRPQRGPRRDRHRRRRARGGGPGVLRAPGPGGRAQGLHRRQGRGPRRPASWSARILEGLYCDEPPLGVPKQVLVPVEPDDPDALRGVARRAARGSRVDDPGAAAGRQARAAGDGHPQRQGGVHPPPAAPGRRPQQPGPGAQRAAGRTSACPRPRCASSATT